MTSDDTHVDAFIHHAHALLRDRAGESGGSSLPTPCAIGILSTPIPSSATGARDDARVLNQLKTLNRCVTGLVRAAQGGSLAEHVRPSKGGPVVARQMLASPVGLVALEAPSSVVTLFNRVIECPYTDREATRALLATLPWRTHEYHVDICDLSLKGRMDLLGADGYRVWRAEFPRWVDCGMLYPLAVAARQAPLVDHWLRPEEAETTVGKAFAGVLSVLALRIPIEGRTEKLSVALGELSAHWHDPAPGCNGVRDHLIGRLDTACMQMGIKSNGAPGTPLGFDLEHALRGFAQGFPTHATSDRDGVDAAVHTNNQAAWPGLSGRVQAAFPPSTLYACFSSGDAFESTWGFDRLTLCTTPTRYEKLTHPGIALHFSERAVSVVSPASAPTRSGVEPPAPLIHEALRKLGAVALSPDVASVLLTGVETDSMRPEDVLRCMCIGAPASDWQLYHRRTMELELSCAAQALPTSRETFVMWRLDLPCVCLRHQGPAVLSSHAEMVDWTSTVHVGKHTTRLQGKPETVSEAWTLPSGPVSEVQVRQLVTRHFASCLPDHPAHTTRVRVGAAAVRSTALAEALVCLSAPPPTHVVTDTSVHSPGEWKGDGIDPRYASVERASNGHRYRDWAALHCDHVQGHTWQSRLASHVISVEGGMHAATVSWTDAKGKVVEVHTRSTLPLDHNDVTGVSLATAVESRYGGDHGLLPVRHVGGVVSRGAVEFYHPRPTLSLLAYSTGQPGSPFELIVFECDPTHLL